MDTSPLNNEETSTNTGWDAQLPLAASPAAIYAIYAMNAVERWGYIGSRKKKWTWDPIYLGMYNG